jgi:hypothetical protein
VIHPPFPVVAYHWVCSLVCFEPPYAVNDTPCGFVASRVVAGKFPSRRPAVRQMKRPQKFTLHRSARPIWTVSLLLLALSLASCADAPPWLGGLPKDAPPRRGTPEYEAWMAQRAAEAARPKQGQEHPK